MEPAVAVLHQAGVIAYRAVDGTIEVLLVTSRDTGRWIIPKGNIGAGSTPAQAANQEAFEEAGVKGIIASSLPLGNYTCSKRLPSGEYRTAMVEVYLMRVKEELKRFPEKRERKLAWVSIADAVTIIEEPGVVPLLQRVAELEDSLARPEADSRSLRSG
jgi:8-oxo-dGTP pyrophosphatase MutT (NUDIX family)